MATGQRREIGQAEAVGAIRAHPHARHAFHFIFHKAAIQHGERQRAQQIQAFFTQRLGIEHAGRQRGVRVFIQHRHGAESR
ncbi:hypothetical protein D3C72_2343460 [compost metagenome]